ncbi:MAG: type II CAAX endopeptidase family protein [Lactobacillus sp.]|nr:type II CAAX endopeptidase family protein [Lactobacillus sp.]
MKKAKVIIIKLLTIVVTFFLYALMQFVYFKRLKVNAEIMSLITLFAVELVWYFYHRFLKNSNKWQFSYKDRIKLKKVLVSILGWILMLAANIVLNLFIYKGGSSANEEALNAILKNANPVFFHLFVIIGAPFFEEIMFRGMLFNLFDDLKKNTKNKIFLILLSGFLFGFCHDPNLTPYFLVYFAMGSILASVYTITGDIRYSMLSHGMLNLIASLG